MLFIRSGDIVSISPDEIPLKRLDETVSIIRLVWGDVRWIGMDVLLGTREDNAVDLDLYTNVGFLDAKNS